MQTYHYTTNGKEIAEWIPSAYGLTLTECLAEAARQGVTWDPAKLPEDGRPRTQTKLTIKRRLDALGKWDTFKAALSSMPAAIQDDWDLAQEISTADPMFVDNAAAIKALLDLTDEQFDGLFR